MPIRMLLALLLVVVSGCSVTTSVNTKQVKAFEQSVQSSYQQIDHLQVVMTPSSINFNYAMKKRVEDEQHDCVFESSYYQTADVSTEEIRNLVDGYQTWTYWDYQNSPILIP